MDQTQLPPLVIPGFIVKKPISHTAMILYGLIFSLQREEGYAYASNAYYAESLGLSIASVKRYLKELVEARLILVHLDRKATDLVQRRIFLHSAMVAFRAYEEEGRQLKSEPCIQDTSTTDKNSTTSESTSVAPEKPTRISREDLADVIEPIYRNYPRKLGKQLGLDRLYQKRFSFEDLPKFAGAVQNYADYCKREKMEEKFILHFSTFVGRWKDWAEVAPKNSALKVVSTLEDLQSLFGTMKAFENK